MTEQKCFHHALGSKECRGRGILVVTPRCWSFPFGETGAFEELERPWVRSENLPVVLCCTVSLCLFQDYCGMAWPVLAQRFKNGLFSSHADEHRLK
jgi:hypothetical protein